MCQNAVITLQLMLIVSLEVSFAQDLPTEIVWERKQIAEGLEWHYTNNELFGAPQFVNVLVISLSKRDISLAYDATGNKPTSEMIEETHALAAVNAVFFDTKAGGSVTYIKIDDELPKTDTSKWKTTEILNGVLLIKKNKRIWVELASNHSVL